MGNIFNAIANFASTTTTNYSPLQMKIYTVTLELYTDDQTDPSKWDWDTMLNRWNVKDLHGMLVSCDRRYDIESTIPSQEDNSDTEPPSSER